MILVSTAFLREISEKDIYPRCQSLKCIWNFHIYFHIYDYNLWASKLISLIVFYQVITSNYRSPFITAITSTRWTKTNTWYSWHCTAFYRNIMYSFWSIWSLCRSQHGPDFLGFLFAAFQKPDRFWPNILRPEQNAWHFADDLFNSIFFDENYCILIKISRNVFLTVQFTLVWIMVWHWTDKRPSFEPMMTPFFWHIYEDFGTRSRYIGHGWVIASHCVLWDAITYPWPRYLLLVPMFSYMRPRWVNYQLKLWREFKKILHAITHHVLIGSWANFPKICRSHLKIILW